MSISVGYNLVRYIDEIRIWKRHDANKYLMEFNENNRTIWLHFYFDYNGDLVIDNVYKDMKNYKNYRYIKKYAENKKLIDVMMQIR